MTFQITGAEHFFEWCGKNDAMATVCYMPACSELEIRVQIFGEYEFYRKRACSFESALEGIMEDYGRQRFQRDGKSRYEQQEITIATLKGCLDHYKKEVEDLKSQIKGKL